MFTGIITATGQVEQVERAGDSCRFRIRSPYDHTQIAMGASIAHDGVCLTVTDKGAAGDGEHWHMVDVSSHTLAHTTLGAWDAGQRINLERALKAGDELGGHIVSGHVDGVATIVQCEREGEYTHYHVEAPEALAQFIAEKGSVTLNGTSLTVTWVDGVLFGLTLVPHTLAVTCWDQLEAGNRLNLEIDMLARYMARYLDYQQAGVDTH